MISTTCKKNIEKKDWNVSYVGDFYLHVFAFSRFFKMCLQF